MASLDKWKAWVDANREHALDVLRIYLGFALLAKGASFIGHMMTLEEQVKVAEFGFSAGAIAHYVVVAHLAGGLLLGLGLLTRVAAAVQVPVLAGAVLFVHAKQGLFTDAMTLELSVLVLFLLLLYTVIGAGTWSIDYVLERKEKAVSSR